MRARLTQIHRIMWADEILQAEGGDEKDGRERERGYREMRGRLGELGEEWYLSPSGLGHV